MTQNPKKIAFLGLHGTYSDLACRTAYPDLETLPCASFEDAFLAVENGDTDLAMIPVDNTLAGRVADVHSLLPHAGLHIIAEHFQPVRHALLGTKGAKITDVQHVHSHIHALPQCRTKIRELNVEKHVHADTASAAAHVAKYEDPSQAAIASSLAAKIYDLDILVEDIQDADHNTTRFVVLSRDPVVPVYDEDMPNTDVLTSFFFRVRNIPAALYKSLGGFATNGINMAKLESYVDKNFQAAQFYCEVEGHPESRALTLAIEELHFYANEVRILGTYPKHPFRNT